MATDRSAAVALRRRPAARSARHHGMEGSTLRDIERGELRAPAKVMDIDIACAYGDEAVDVSAVRDGVVPGAPRWCSGGDPILDVEADSSIALAALRDRYAATSLPRPVKPLDVLDAPITVVICTRDRPESLQKTLASLAPQSDSGFDVLIVDNSRDGEIARTWDGFDGLVIRCCHDLSGIVARKEPRSGRGAQRIHRMDRRRRSSRPRLDGLA